MSCNHPLVRIEYNKTLVSGQTGKPYQAYKILKQDDTEYEWATDWTPDKKLKGFYKNELLDITKVSKVPCWKCDGCRFATAKKFAIRCALETIEHKDNWFITLTYDDNNVPHSEDHEESHTDTHTGEIYEIDNPEAQTLWLPDIQEFNDTIRDYHRYRSHTGIRFYGAGEYGPTTQRPHYHYIYYNLPIEKEDMHYIGKNRNGQKLWTSEKLAKMWGNGHIAIGQVTFESCAYVAQYCTKKQGGALYGDLKEEFYKRQGKMPEFVHMSRRPGIGRTYYEKNWEEIYKNDEIIIATKKGVQTVQPSNYYDSLYDLENHEDMERIKEERRRKARENLKCELSRTTLTEKEYLQQKERTLKDRTKILTRKGLDTPLKC